MSAVAKPKPHSVEDLLLAAKRGRKEVKHLLGQAVLQGRPEPEIAQLQEELQTHERNIERFTAAIEAQAQTKAEQTLEDRRAAVTDARTAIASRDEEIESLVRELLAKIDDCGPLASQLRAAVTARNTALRDGLKASLGRAEWDRLVEHGGPGLTPLPIVAAAVSTALIDAALPAVGVHLDVSAPLQASELAPSLQRIKDRTEALLRKADRSIQATTIIDDDEEV